MGSPLSGILRYHHVRVDHLTAGDQIWRYGRHWIVQETLPVFFEGGHAVIALDTVTAKRTVLMWDEDSSVAAVAL